jgi:hypothetical protein
MTEQLTVVAHLRALNGHDVKSTETVDRFLNRLSHVLPFCDIECHGNRPFAFLSENIRNGFSVRALDVRNHGGAFLS